MFRIKRCIYKGNELINQITLYDKIRSGEVAYSKLMELHQTPFDKGLTSILKLIKYTAVTEEVIEELKQK